jgi:uncharacterized protein
MTLTSGVGIARGEVGPVKLLVLQGTPFCNINCKYCYLPDRSDASRMSVETVEAVVSRLREDRLLKGPLLVNWHAGEPLVLPPNYYRARIPAFVPLADDGIKVEQSLQTNGILIDDAFCDLFQEFNIAIGVSVDGPAFIHDRERLSRSGGPTHALTDVGMRKLRDRGISFNAICVLTDFSLQHPDGIYDYFRDAGVRAVGFNIEEIEGSNTRSSITTVGYNDRFRAFLERFWERVEGDGGLLRVREFDDGEARILDRHERRNSQTDPLVNVSVAWNGEWSTFCPELLGLSFPGYPTFMLGNVHTGGFRAALETERFKRLHADIQAGVDRCKAECAYFDICAGSNPSNKISENGSFSSTETINCRNRIMTVGNFMMDRIEERIAFKRAQASA